MNQEIISQIKKILDEVRPHLQMDGGDVDFVSFDENSGLLELKLKGACSGCPMSQFTLQEGIGRVVKERIKDVKEVVAV